QLAVPVIIDKRASRREPRLWLKQARLFRDVRKCAVAVVAVENVLSPVSEKQILESVVVVIANGYTVGITRPEQPGLFRNITECAVPIVLVQAIGCSGRRISKARTG